MNILNALVSGIMWPPSYYVLRDRIPFFLTILYLFGSKIPFFNKYSKARLGLVLTIETAAVTLAAVYLYFTEDSMIKLAGIHWSFPSPIQWGIFITVSTLLLTHRSTPIFEAYYLSLLAALAGGWIYEVAYSIPHWVNSGFAPWNWMKINAIKVFFVEFQVLCLPILIYIIKTTKEYKTSKLLKYAVFGALIFYGFGEYIKPFIHRFGQTAYMWVLRVPTQITLFLLLYGIKGDKK